jgi:hypothetical protein
MKINVYPTHEDDITCYNMKTFTQGDKQKGEELCLAKKDYILTDLRLCDTVIVMVDGTPITK